MSVSKWWKAAAATSATALVLVVAPGSIDVVGGQEGPEGFEDPTPTVLAPNPFDGLDLSDPLAAREEVQRRLGESAATSEVLAELVGVAGAELASAQQRSAAANEWLESARVEAASAIADEERAEQKATRAARRAVDARAAARDALVDAYITPPVGDATRLTAVADVNDSFFLHGLLTSRAQSLTELLDAADRAEATAATASSEASKASVSATAAAAEATAAADAAAAASAETGERLADLQLFVGLVDAQVESLAVVDQLLQQLVAQRAASASAAAGPPVAASEVSAVSGTTIRVHRSVVDMVSAMVFAAAADGVVLNGFGWRTVESQVALRHAHCGSSPEQVYLVPASSCSPPTARPGSSMHERGLAVDFSNCSARSTPCFLWLAENAHRFGFYNLPSEPWHWSVNGN